MGAPIKTIFTLVILIQCIIAAHNSFSKSQQQFTSTFSSPNYPSFFKLMYRPRKPTFTQPRPSCVLLTLICSLLLSGDIEANPGPNSIYPCGYCEHPVTWDHQRAICCDIWYHSICLEVSSKNVELLQH